MEDIPPFLLSGLRFLLAGSIMAAIGFVKKDPLPQWQNVKSAAVMGFLFLVMGTAMVVWAEQFIDTGLAALMAAFEPVMVVFFVWLCLCHKHLYKRNIVLFSVCLNQTYKWFDMF